MKKIHMTLFSALVLVIVLMTLYGTFTGKKDQLFDRGTKTTYYAETEVGKPLELKAEQYFSEEEYDLSKFSFDLTGCDWNTAGIYEVPIRYGGRETNAAVSVDVRKNGEMEPVTKEGMNEDTVIAN